MSNMQLSLQEETTTLVPLSFTTEPKRWALMIVPTTVFIILMVCCLVISCRHPGFIIGGIIALIVGTIVIPICGYWIYEFYRYRHAQFISARGYEINIRLALLMLFMLAVERPALYWLNAAEEWGDDDSTLWKWMDGLTWPIIGSTIVGAMAYGLAWKTILIQHEYQHMKSCQDDQWHHYLVKPIMEGDELSSMTRDDSFIEQIRAPNQVLDSSGTRGNRWWVFKRLLVIYCIHMSVRLLSGFLFIAGVVTMEMNRYLESGLFLIVVFIMFIFWCLTPAFYDMFYVRREMQVIIYASVLRLVTMFIGVAIAGNVAGWIVVYDFQFIYSILFQYVPICMALTWYPVKKGLEKGFIDNKSAQTPFTRTSSLSTSNVMTPRKASAHGKRVGLRAVLGDKKTISLFAYHLVEEFSVECILAVIEFGKFKAKMYADAEFMAHVTVGEFEDLGSEIPQIPLKNLPKSRIVGSTLPHAYAQFCTDDRFKQYKVRAWLLFNRYIDPNTAELEINISYSMRQALIEKMSTIEKWMAAETTHNDIWSLYTGATKVMLGLMGDAFSRFISTEGYRKCEKHLYKADKSPRPHSKSPRPASKSPRPAAKSIDSSGGNVSPRVETAPLTAAILGVSPANSPRAAAGDTEAQPKGFFQTIDFEAIDDDD